MKYLSRLLCVAILIWAIFSFSTRPSTQSPARAPLPPPMQEEKISLKSSAPLKKGRKNRVLELSEWIEEDRLCDGKGNYQRQHDTHESAALYQALERVRGNLQPNPCLAGLLSSGKKQILRYARESEQEGCQFLTALVLTGQLGLEEKSSAREMREGELLLKKLAALYPENGIYPFFLLGISKNRDHLRDFLRANEFRNPLTRLAPRLREIGLLNTTAFFYSTEALATMKVPDYQAALSAAREGVNDPTMKGDYLAWLKSYLENLEEIQRLKIGEPFITTIEIAVLRSIATTGWKAHGEGPKSPLLEQKPWKKLFRTLTNMDAFEPFYVNEDQSCERIHDAAKSLLPDFAALTEAMARRWAEYR